HRIAISNVLDPGNAQTLAEVHLDILESDGIQVIFLGFKVDWIEYCCRQWLVIVERPLVAEWHFGVLKLLAQGFPLYHEILDVEQKTHAFPWPVPLVETTLGRRMTMLHVPFDRLVVP